MAARRINPRVVKIHRSYDVAELATLLSVHKNTIRLWQGEGLKPLEGGRPLLFQGAVARAFLTERNANRKSPCPPGTLYCFRCRAPRPPALEMVDYTPITATGGNLRAFCEECETTMHRRVRKASIAAIFPGCDVQVAEGQPTLSGRPHPSLNIAFEAKTETS